MTDRIVTGSQWRLAISDASEVGECRRRAKQLADGYGFGDVAAGRISIIATELATNIVRHAGRGEILIQVLDDGIEPELELLAIDRGPGMHNVEACMRDGYSSGGTAGEGLGAVFRLSSTFDVYSRAGQGTVVLSRSTPKGKSARRAEEFRQGFEFGAISIAVAGEIECGDTWRIAESGTLASIFLADGLGHGPLAATAAQAAASAFGAHPFQAPAAAMQCYHRALGGTRGAAAATALLNFTELTLHYAGVGNIGGTLVTPERTRGLASHNGTLGIRLVRAQEFTYDWLPTSRLVMYSDGLSGRFSLSEYPDLYLRHSGVVAAVLYRDFARARDDATVVVACHRK